MVPRKIGEQRIEQLAAGPKAAVSGCNSDAQFGQWHTRRVTAQWRTAVIGPGRTYGRAVVVLGDDRHHPIGWEHLNHFVVVGVGEWPVFNDAGMTRHLNDERLVIRRRRTKHGALSCHRQIVADAFAAYTFIVQRAETAYRMFRCVELSVGVSRTFPRHSHVLNFDEVTSRGH